MKFSEKLLVTGSAGLVGSECVRFFPNKGFHPFGTDNNMRKAFFGEEASVEWNNNRLIEEGEGYNYYREDIENPDRTDNMNLEKVIA